jgi:hypothetical protein
VLGEARGPYASWKDDLRNRLGAWAKFAASVRASETTTVVERPATRPRVDPRISRLQTPPNPFRSRTRVSRDTYDQPNEPRLQRLERGAPGEPFTQYTGKKNLFDRLFFHLCKPGREEDLTAWFVYRVYRELVNGRPDAFIKDPDDPIIRSIATEIIRDPAIVKSIRRYQGRELIWFGEWTAPDGRLSRGGSSETMAYKRVSSLLRDYSTGVRQAPRRRSRTEAMQSDMPRIVEPPVVKLPAEPAVNARTLMPESASVERRQDRAEGEPAARDIEPAPIIAKAPELPRTPARPEPFHRQPSAPSVDSSSDQSAEEHRPRVWLCVGIAAAIIAALLYVFR